MRRVRYLAALLITLALTAVAGSRTASADQPVGIQVRGQGVVTARPDVALLTLGASVRRDTAAAAFSRAEELVTALTASLHDNGVPDADIQTRQFSLNPEFGRSNDTNPAPITGWRATHTVAVKLRDFTRIGATIDSAVATLDGDAIIQGITFTVEDTNAVVARARAAALADARTKAEAIAAQAGVRLGNLLSIVEVSSPAPTPVREVAAPAAAPFAGQASVQISPGEQSLTVILDVVYAIG